MKTKIYIRCALLIFCMAQAACTSTQMNHNYFRPDEVSEANAKFAFELRQGVDVVFTWGSYGRDFWYDTSEERVFKIRPNEDVVQYFLPFPPVRDPDVLNLSGRHVYAEETGVEGDKYWVVIYDPPKGGQERGHIAFQTFSEEPYYVPTRYVVMVRPEERTSPLDRM